MLMKEVLKMVNNEKSNSVLNVFDAMANEYVEYFGDDWEFIDEINDFASNFKKDSTIIDLGSGSGYITNYLCEKNLNAIGVDFSETMIKIAENKYPNTKFILSDFINVEKYFKESSVDGLIAIYSLYFIPKEKFNDLLKSLSKILKDGGKFLFITQVGKGENFVVTPLMEDNNIDGKIYVNYYMKEELEDILENNGFSIESFVTKSDHDEKEITDDGRYIVVARKK